MKGKWRVFVLGAILFDTSVQKPFMGTFDGSKLSVDKTGNEKFDGVYV